jgi:hypothetical protein
MVTMRMAAAASVITHAFRWLLDGMSCRRERSCAPYLAGIHALMPGRQRVPRLRVLISESALTP